MENCKYFEDGDPTCARYCLEIGPLCDEVSNPDHLLGIVNAERDQITYKAEHDELTGLFNKNAFRKIAVAKIQAARERDGQLAAIFIDITKFKQFNDTYGHLTGDVLLREFAGVLCSELRTDPEGEAQDIIKLEKTDPDFTAGRYGGDEFVVLFDLNGRPTEPDGPNREPLLAEERLAITAGRLNRIFVDFFASNPQYENLSAALGVQMWEPKMTFDMLMEGADAQMYRHKRSQHQTYHGEGKLPTAEDNI